MKRPRFVHVRLTSDCTLTCDHCYASTWLNRHLFLSDRILDEIVSFAAKNDCERLTLTGGEPLLHPRAICMAERAVRSGLKVEIETNGICLDPVIPRLLPLADALRLRVSYDGSLRGAHAAGRSLNACIAAQHAGLRVAVQISLYGETLSDPRPVLDAVADAELDGRVFIGHATFGRGRLLERVRLPRALELASLIRTYPRLTPVLPKLIDPQASCGSCGWRTERCEIMPDGSVTACGPSTFSHPDWNAGNMATMTLQDIWENSVFFQQLRRLTQAEFEEPCDNCKFFDLCEGACRAVAWSVRDNLMAAYPWCYDSVHSVERNSL